MNDANLVNDPTKLSPSYFPNEIVNREDTRKILETTYKQPGLQNLYLYGPRGTGKTYLANAALQQVQSQIETYYLSCIQHNSQYKILKELYSKAAGEEVPTGHHTAKLQRDLEEQLSETHAVIVLDEIDFLIGNEGNDLLYYLSRSLQHATIVLISSNHPNPSSLLEERTQSSLQPRSVTVSQYSEQETYDILSNRISDELRQHTIHPDAVRQIASQTRNIRLALHWLHYAVSNADAQVTKELIRDVQGEALQRYWDILLQDFSPHHHLLLEAIQQLVDETDGTVRTGQIYDRFEELCEISNESPVSQRRLSDYLKHLEALNIIDATYSYGGPGGKTRYIELNTHLPLHTLP